MDFLKPSSHHHHHQALENLQTLWSNITDRIPKFPSSSSSVPNNNNNNPFCSLSSYFHNRFWKKNNQALSPSEIKKRMVGIPAYKISTYSQVPVGWSSDHDPDRAIQLRYINKGDAEDFFRQDMMERERLGLPSSEHLILDIPLHEIVDYEGTFPPVRLVPESSQVKNAIELRKKNLNKDVAEFLDESFSGVPVFQSDHVTIMLSGTEKIYRGAYLRKEDLENLLTESEQRDTIKVATFENIIQEMKDTSTSESNDVFFVGPGITSWAWLSEE